MNLTRRELEVANQVAEGLTNRAIAARLHLSERTVEGHIEHALNKLGMSSRTQLAIWVGRSGLASAAAPRPASGIPRQMTSFVGREKDIQGLLHVLADQRIVTLAGSGGSGKTRLAFEVATQIQLVAKQKVWYVDLSATSDPGLVVQAVAGSLGVVVEGSAGEELASRLRDVSGVLVLDNCEHLAAACAGLIGAIAAGCPGIQFLITSRESLRIPGEHVWRVQPLSIPPRGAALQLVAETESVRLFVDRARAIVAGFEIDDDNWDAIAEVCRRLDGLPLAIELAAARVGLLSPAQIANRLDDRFALLVAESSLGPDRQRTLRATLQWSYDLLPPVERTLFRRLAVFNGSFNLEAAEAVCGVDPLPAVDVVALLGRLADRSLVVVGRTVRNENRYRLLDSTRTYAAELFTADEDRQQVTERHSRLYGAIAVEAGDRLGGPDAQDWTDLVAEEMDNLRSALDWAIGHDTQLGLAMCASLGGFWDFQGALYEGRRWLSRALESDLNATANRAAALAAAGSLAFRQADYALARQQFEESLAIAESVCNRALSARALAGLGDVLNLTGDPDGAAEKYAISLELYRAEGDKLSVARGLTRLAGVANVRRDFQAAESLGQQSLEEFRILGDQVGIANQLFTIGAARLNLKKYVSARDYFAQSLKLRRELGDLMGIAYSSLWLACSEILAGNLAAACEPLEEGLKACDAAGDLRGVSIGLDITLGLLLNAGSARAGLRVEAAAQNIRSVGGFLGMPPFQPVLDGWIATAMHDVPLPEAEYEDTVGRSLTAASAIQFATEQIRAIHDRLTSSKEVSLTPRENEIVRLVAEGLSNREIGERMDVSERTVDTHIQHVLNKLDFRSRAQIAAWHAGSRRVSAAVAMPGKQNGDRFVTTILVVDMVGSTSKASQIGDAQWRKLLDQHYEKVRMELQKHHGVEIDTAGDGMMATFDGPASAIRCAWAIQRDDRALGLASRAAVHSGEVERADSAIRGIAVHVAARLAGVGLADEVIVSATTRDLAAGSGIRFENRGKKRLKGVPESRSVFAAIR